VAKLISLADIKQLPPGSRLDVDEETIITPLAADHAREHGITIYKGGRPVVQPWPRNLTNRERDPRHFRDIPKSNWPGNRPMVEPELPSHTNPQSFVHQVPEGTRPERVTGAFTPTPYQPKVPIFRPYYYQDGGTDFDRLPSWAGNLNLRPSPPEKREGMPYARSRVRQENDPSTNWRGNPSVPTPGASPFPTPSEGSKKNP